MVHYCSNLAVRMDLERHLKCRIRLGVPQNHSTIWYITATLVLLLFVWLWTEGLIQIIRLL
ncbi:hypothetical protein GBA52_029130 [Prunus armeniaca]|nr:hypothetical protein GBA52_029130 [Prunus armeniaca]